EIEIRLGTAVADIRNVLGTPRCTGLLHDRTKAVANLVGELIPATQRGFADSKPGNLPCKSHSRPKVVPIVGVPGDIGMRRVLSDVLEYGGFATRSRPHPIVETSAGNPKRRRTTANWKRHQPVRFIRHAQIVISKSEVQREFLCRFPIILENQAESVEPNIANFSCI